MSHSFPEVVQWYATNDAGNTAAADDDDNDDGDDDDDDDDDVVVDDYDNGSIDKIKKIAHIYVPWQ